MTAREKNLWLLVGLTFLALPVYFLISNGCFGDKQATDATGNVAEAVRLLRAERKIEEQRREAIMEFNRIQKQFYHKNQSGQVELALLDLIEDEASSYQLGIKLKDTIRYSEDECGVSLEGVASPGELLRFLHHLTELPEVLTVKKLQLHTVQEGRMLDYKLEISAVLI